MERTTEAAAVNGAERIAYLDFIRGISILLVVFCHFVLLNNEGVAGNVVMCLAWGAVPCFFMVSGGVLHQKKEFVWKKYICRLLQVYFVLCVWKIIYLLVTCLYTNVSFSKVELITYIFLFGSISGVHTGVMWFTQAYLLLLLFYPISWFLFRHFEEGKKILFFLLILLFVIGPLLHGANFLLEIFSSVTGRNLLSLSSFNVILPFANSDNVIFYFLLGALLFNYKESIMNYFRNKARRVWIPITCIGAGVMGLMLIKYWQAGSFRWEGIYLDDGYSWISTILIAIGLYLLIQNYLGRIRMRWLECIGKNTMGIYYLHYILLAFLSTTVFWAGLAVYGSLLLNLIKAVVITVICLFVTIGLKHIPLIKRLVI